MHFDTHVNISDNSITYLNSPTKHYCTMPLRHITTTYMYMRMCDHKSIYGIETFPMTIS